MLLFLMASLVPGMTDKDSGNPQSGSFYVFGGSLVPAMNLLGSGNLQFGFFWFFCRFSCSGNVQQ